MFKANQNVKVKVIACKTNHHFSLCGELNVTITEPTFKKDLTNEIKQIWLDEINKPLTRDFYTLKDVRVQYC